ncbi:PepSY domain-containing protein [Niveispirillum sp.]|uniref:PepSY domain-containing protein n=1 Tax=Niveispirillum sp. TaxID=1917217 RepID=UPI001B514E03|nr:PepSY domain-containing protein [Niveispirillum sp.]MBP7336649.1 PepSY domain-containing protein [Niveispirillum sp.]
MKTLLGTAALALVLAHAGPSLAAPSDGEVAAFRQAKVSLTQAIAQAEKQGKAVGVDFDTKESVGLYQIDIVSGETVTRWDVDASNGKIASADKQTLATWVQKMGAGIEPGELTASATSLAQAIGIAENKAGGKAIEADVEHSDNRLTYEIEVLNGTTTRTVRVDGASGQVLADKS